MSVEPVVAIALSGAIGAAFGAVMTSAWFATKREQHRSQFLREFEADFREAMISCDSLLSNMDLPKDIRIALIRLLAAHANPDLGARLADGFLKAVSQPREDRNRQNPLVEAMASLFASNRKLARTAHEAISTLAMGLLVVHKGDTMQVEKVQTQASRDPERLLDKVFQASKQRATLAGQINYA